MNQVILKKYVNEIYNKYQNDCRIFIAKDILNEIRKIDSEVKLSQIRKIINDHFELQSINEYGKKLCIVNNLKTFIYFPLIKELTFLSKKQLVIEYELQKPKLYSFFKHDPYDFVLFYDAMNNLRSINKLDFTNEKIKKLKTIYDVWHALFQV